jgi:hypothetical protein
MPATYCMCVVCCSTMVVILCCGVSACWELSSRYRSWWSFDLRIKSVKAEHDVRGIPLGLFIRGLGCNNLNYNIKLECESCF